LPASCFLPEPLATSPLAFQDNSLLLARQAFANAIHLGFRISAVIVLVVTAMIVKWYDGELELPRAN